MSCDVAVPEGTCAGVRPLCCSGELKLLLVKKECMIRRGDCRLLAAARWWRYCGTNVGLKALVGGLVCLGAQAEAPGTEE